ncbi:MAG TPA: AAA family ATPase, partial [Ktedonobacterales bacterium]|nr:AAA family ATPase [Ktedonobacterales bacterium]
DFKNTIIIMTTNAGASELGKRAVIGFTSHATSPTQRESRESEALTVEDVESERMRAVVMTALEKLFRPEFLNRVDDIVVFQRLTTAQAKEVLRLLLAQTQTRLAEQQITLRVTPKAERWLIAKGFDDEFGARSLRRIVQSQVEDLLAEALLLGDARPGETLTLDCADHAGKTDRLILRRAPALITSGRAPTAP